jgi:uncharacterized membrane protein|tara:strand:- start:220 stop:1092 length:873 start_codon:yes stop_codon:yes gene_type:complete
MMMQWYHYALLTAFTLGIADTLVKKAAEKNDEYTLTLVRLAYTLPFIIPALFFIKIPPLDTTFFSAAAIAIPIDITALTLYQRAIKISPLSLTLPFLAFTPVFVVVTSFVLLEEIPNVNSLVGIVLVFLGVYLLNIHDIYGGFLEPLKSLKKEKGARIMLIVAFLFSININVGKIMAIHSSPAFLATFYMAALAVSYVIFLIATGKTYAIKNLKNSPFLFSMIGLFVLIHSFTHFIAVTMTNVASMVSVKRTSVLFSIIFAAMFLKEFHCAERFIGTAVMITGVWLIIVF